MVRVALRGNVWTGVGFAALGVLYVLFLVTAYASLGADRASAARDLETIGAGFSFIIALPQRLDTNAGYLAWFGYGQLVAVFSFWGISAGTYASRAEDERGLSDLWLAAGVTRRRVILAHATAFAIAASVALGVAAAAAAALSAIGGEPIPGSALALQSVGVLAVTLLFFAIGLCAGQVVSTRRGALGVAALILVGLFLLNGFSRQWDALSAIRWVSPFAYYDRVHGLVPGVPFGTGNVMVLFSVAAAALLVAIVAFDARDLGATLGRRGTAGTLRRLPATNPVLRSQVLTALYDQRVSLTVWCLAIAWQSFFITRLADPFLRALAGATANDASAAQLRAVTGTGHGAPFEGFVGFEWFSSLACLGVAAYAITQVARWASEDTEGRLELLLAAPLARSRVVAQRALALAVAVTLLVLVSHLGIALGTAVNEARLDPGRLAVASAMLLPVAGVFGGIGAAASAWRPRLTVALLSGLAVLSFFLPFVQPVIRGPEWLPHLSVFDLYGTPLSDGFEAWRFGWLTAITGASFALAVVAMRRRDIGR